MTTVKLVLQLILLLCLINAPAAVAAPSLAKSNCQAECGNVSIPYPFGIGKDCYHDTWYEITCNDSFNPPKPFLTRLNNLEVLNVSLSNTVYYSGNSYSVSPQTVTVNSSIASSCQGHNLWTSTTNLRDSPFNFSDYYNTFTVLGCENALFTTRNGTILAGCTSICRNINMEGCYGIDCCQTSIPYDLGLDIYGVNYTTRYNSTATNCTYAFLLDRNYQLAGQGKFSTRSLTSIVKETEHAPLSLDWGIINPPPYVNLETEYTKYYCEVQGMMSNRVQTYSCNCRSIYEGNPFLPNGCQVVEECTQCKGHCDRSQDNKFVCYRSKPMGIILGVSISGGSLLLFLGGFWLFKVIRRMRKIKLKKKFFKRNGGLLLQQQLSSNEATIEKTKIFTSKELEKATENFNRNRILGQGGQGIVYKGMLTDGRIVAIKKSKLVDESQLEQFINEVVILSQINHRNVVNLLGCCLETNVPLLVYEFVSNGNLFELIHDQIDEFPFSWEMRLQIATEVAGAVAYLHSASSIPIYHRDIKSTNILLDDKYKAKVSDFGTSRSISIEQTHLTTLVHGTFGYLDPEYFQSSQFTEKSDVYSFGVVLAELLTGQKPISTIRSQEDKSLATYFILSLKENRLFDILDARVMKEGGKEEIKAVANIAKRCLNLNGKKRPTMKEVTMELEAIRSSPMPLNSQQNFEDDEYIVELTGPMDGVSVSVSSCSDHTGASSLDVHPLLYNKV